jgi:hypothetical protein
MINRTAVGYKCSKCGREEDWRDGRLETCLSDDCPSKVLPTMVRTSIGTISNGIDGHDEYILVKSIEDDITPAQARDYLMPFFYKRSSHPGGYFCDMISVTPVQYSTNEVIATVHHRYDI